MTPEERTVLHEHGQRWNRLAVGNAIEARQRREARIETLSGIAGGFVAGIVLTLWCVWLLKVFG